MAGPAGAQPLNIAEWEETLNKMLRYHFLISEEIKAVVIAIRKEMKPELVPIAEEKANYGKILKRAIREMWALEYEIDDIQQDFMKSMGEVDINNLTDDFIEDMLLQSKPLQTILMNIRLRQKSKMEEIKKDYWKKIGELEPLPVKRPDRSQLKEKLDPPPPPAEEKKEGEAAPAPAEGAPPAEGAAPPAEGDAAAPPPAEPAPAIEPAAAPAVEAAA